MANTLDVLGASDRVYQYTIYPIGTTFKQNPGNYIFSKPSEPTKEVLIYVGQTGDLSERFDNHHKMECIKENGATNICVHTSSDNEETKIWEYY